MAYTYGHVFRQFFLPVSPGLAGGHFAHPVRC
jgi:hypothetical protein